MNKFISALLCVFLITGIFAGCSANKTGNGETENVETTTGSVSEADFSFTDADMFSSRDYEVGFKEEAAVKITLNGKTATTTSDSVKISDNTVTITEESTYVLSGELSDGQIIIDAPETAKIQLVLDGVTINSEKSAPIYILEGDKVFVTLADNTQNTLSNGGEFSAIDENNIDSVIFSKQDITFNGSGNLTVTSPAGHGIVSKDDLVITSGIYTINCASHGIDANDSVRISNASISIDAGKDGIHAENTDNSSLGFVYISNGEFEIEAEGDGISAGNYLHIKNGMFNILSGGGSENGTKTSSDFYGGFMGGGMGGNKHDGMKGGMNRPMSLETDSSSDTSDSSTSIKGLKSTGSMLIENGSFNINSADDSVHSNLSVTVNGGSFEIASGDDGFHADETLTINAGTINISECYEGLEALNVAVNGGDIKLKATDDGLNAAGGTDSSGTAGRGGDMFSGHGGGPGGMGGGMSSSSNGSIIISGGTLYVNSSGDGMDANGYLEITGGYITVVGPTYGDTATLDYDTSATITGGTFIGTGASGMAQTFSDSSQGIISLSVGNQIAGTAVNLKDSNGNTIISCSPELDFAVLILSSPDIVSGKAYTVEIGSYSGEFQAS